MVHKLIQPVDRNSTVVWRRIRTALLLGSCLWFVQVTVHKVLADEPSKKSASQSNEKDGSAVKVTEIEGISEYRLSNGVRVLLFPDASKDVVTVNMTIFVGSRHEGYGEAGMAHLLEHMLFKGTPTHEDIPKALKDRGAGRSMNGTTWMDRTNYYETLPATGDNLEFAIRLEADRLVNSKILGEDLASEMTVVRNEFENGENSPFRVLMQRMQAAAFEWHNYGRSTIGNRSDIERVPVVKLRKFYRKFYRPDNVMVVVAGKFEGPEALTLIEKYFGALKRPDTPIDGTYTVEPPQDGERTVAVRRAGEVQLVGAAYHIPPGSHPDYAAVKALVSIMSDRPSGRLYKNIVETEIGTNAFSLSYAFAEPGLFMALVEVPTENSLEDARQKLIEVMETSLIDEPVTEQEVQRAVQKILKTRELQAADSDKIAVSLSDWAAQGDWRLYFLFRDQVEKLTREQVQKVAEKYFVRSNRTVGLFIPSAEIARVEMPEAPDLAVLLDGYQGREAVAAGEQIDPAPLAIEARTERGELIEGVQYALLPKKTRGEVLSMKIAIRFGSPETLKGKIAAVELLGWMMSKGTQELDYADFQDELTRLRTNLSLNSTVGLLDVTLKTKREFLPRVLEILGDVLRRPRLDADELEVIRRQIVTSIESGRSEPQSVAIRNVKKSLSPYGKDDIRYVQNVDEEIEMYQQVQIEQIRSLHNEILSNQAVEISVVGDFDSEELKTMLKPVFSDWDTSIKYSRVGRPAHPEIAGSTESIETPDKAGAFLYGSEQFTLSDTTPEHASLVLGNYILGGGSLSSRLGNRVRQEEALSYGVGSALRERAKDKRVDFIVYASSNPENKKRLIEAIREELDRISKDGITQKELEEAKVAYLQAARVRRSTDAAIASELLGTMFLNRTMQQAADHEQQIQDATVDSVNDAIKKFIHSDKLVMAIAGDFAAPAKPSAPSDQN